MKKTTIGWLLVGGAGVVWLISYQQQQAAISAGTLDPSQALTWSDRLFSPAGVALVVGTVLLYPELKRMAA